MKHFYVFIVLILSFFITNTLRAQAPGIQWQRCYGGSGADRLNEIQPSKDGGYILAGSSQSGDGDLSPSHGGQDVWVVKIDAYGNIQWQKSFGGNSDEGAQSIQSTPDGGYVVGATTASRNGDVTGKHGDNFTLDFWIIKLDSMGNIAWQKCLGGQYDENLFSVQPTYDGGYIAVGSSDSNDGDVTGHHSDQFYKTRDYWVVKLNSSGIIQWQRSLGGTQDETATSVQQTRDGGFIVAGISSSRDGDVLDHYGFGTDIWLVKLSTIGSIEWRKSFGGTKYEEAWSIKEATDGGFIVAGNSNSTDGDVSGNHGVADFWVVKLNSTGSIKWQKSYGGSGQDLATAIALATEGGYIITGLSSSNDGQVMGNHGLSDVWALKINDQGDIEWQKALGGSSDDVGTSIHFTSDGYILVGSTYSSDKDVSGKHSGLDAWIVRLKSTPCVPTIHISTPLPGICAGTSVTFTADATSTGTAPTYQWKVNGINSGTNSNTFTSSTLNNNDVIICELTSNAPCATTPTATSNSIKITVSPSPVATITGDTCVGSVLTVNSNIAPSSLVWKLNGTTTVSTQTAGLQTNAVTIAGGNGLGTNANQLNRPAHFYIDASGNIYIPDMDNNRIQKWAAGATTGVTIAGGTGTGSALNQLDRPTSVSIDSKGNMYVTDQNNNRVLKYAPGSTTGTVFGYYFDTPTDVFIDAADNIYISQQNSSVITKYPAGSSTGVTVAGGNGWGSAANQFSSATGIFVDAAGNIYVCDTDNNRVQKWAPGASSGITVAGGNGNGSGSNQLAYPLGVFVDSQGNVYVADYFNARVQKWAPGATQGVTVAGGNGPGTGANQLNRPESVWINEDGDLIVADLANHRIQKFPNSLTKTYTTLTVGDYTATVTSANGCTSTSNIITVVASKTPTVSITSTGTAICLGVPVTFTASHQHGGSAPLYQWKINGANAGTNSNNATFTSANLKAGDVVSCLITSNANLCLTSKTATSNAITLTNASTGKASITVSPTDTTICEGANLAFTATPVNGGTNPTYQWKVNGVNVTNNNRPTFSSASFNNGDVVTCVLTSSANLCPDSLVGNSNAVTIRTTAIKVPSISITANDSIICTGSMVNFTASSVNYGTSPVYRWSINGVNAGSNSSTYSSSQLKNNDAITCSVTSSMQCALPATVASNTITMDVDDKPVIKIRPDTTIFVGSTTRLTTSVTGNVSTYRWSPTSTLNDGTIASPLATPATPTTYKLLVTTPGGCEASAQVTITTITEVIIANAFSPNNDGINDVWSIPGLSSYKDCSVQVFNRYGQLLFQSKGYDKPWNGTINGQALPVGTYYYIITLDKSTPKKSGGVTLIK